MSMSDFDGLVSNDRNPEPAAASTTLGNVMDVKKNETRMELDVNTNKKITRTIFSSAGSYQPFENERQG